MSIPLGAAYVALFAGLVASVVFAVQLIGVLIFLVVLAAARAFGGLERRLTRRMLDVDVEDCVQLRHQNGRVIDRLRALLTASSTWRTIAWLGTRALFAAGVVGVVLFGIGVVVVLVEATPVAVVIAPLVVLGVLGVVDLEVRAVGTIAPALLGVSPKERLEALRQTSLRLAERNSVARDLHDTIGHTLTATLLQATAARKTLTPDPDSAGTAPDPVFARQALAHIEDNTRAALAELDRALAVLGDRRGMAAPDGMEADSAPDLGDIGALVVGLRDGGLPLTLAVHAAVDDIPVQVSRLAYRVVQEGTTNVLRHAGSAPTLVEVTQQGDDVLVRVHNDVSGRIEQRPGPGGGHGLEGLRERCVSLGGQLTAVETDDGGFELAAALPRRRRG